MTDHAVVIAGGGPTGLMLLASGRWRRRRRRRRKTHQPRGRRVASRWHAVPSCRDTPVACGKPPGRAARVSGANEKARKARRG
jgi:hypothetical protein